MDILTIDDLRACFWITVHICSIPSSTVYLDQMKDYQYEIMTTLAVTFGTQFIKQISYQMIKSNKYKNTLMKLNYLSLNIWNSEFSEKEISLRQESKRNWIHINHLLLLILMGKTCKPYQIEGAEESAELELKVEGNISPYERITYFLRALCSFSCHKQCILCPVLSHMLQPEALSSILHGKQEVTPHVGFSCNGLERYCVTYRLKTQIIVSSYHSTSLVRY